MTTEPTSTKTFLPDIYSSLNAQEGLLGQRRAVSHLSLKYNLDDPLDRRQISWVLMFTDLMALMLTFFVLLFSMSSPKLDYWDEVTASTAIEQDVPQAQEQMDGFTGPDQGQNIVASNLSQGHNLTYVRTILEGLIARLPEIYREQIKITDLDDRLVIYAPTHWAFAEASTDLQDSGQALLTRMATLFEGLDNQIMIVGHASERELRVANLGETQSASSASNEVQNNPQQLVTPHLLALQRALTTSRLMQEFGYEHPIYLMGAGSGRANMMGDDFTDVQSAELIQRIDIVILEQHVTQ